MTKKILTIFLCLFVFGGAALAETFKIFIGIPPGGPSDVFIRKVAMEAEKISNYKFVVINRPGADFMVSYQAFLEESRSNPNVLFVSTTGTHVSSYIQHADLKLDPINDTKSLILIVRIHLLFVTLKESPINDLSDLRGNLNIGYAGATAPVIIGKMKLDPNIQLVPFRNDAENMLALLRRDIPVAQVTSINNLIPIHRDKIKVIGSMDKMGVVSGQGLHVAKNFPADKLLELNRLFNQVLRDPAVVDWFVATVNTKPAGGTPADYDRLIQTFKQKLIDQP